MTAQNVKTILVIEDEKPLAQAISIKLKKEGFEVIVARKAEEALTCLENATRVDAVWLDHYLLGKENGLDFVARLKENAGKWQKIPVFVVSNSADANNIRSYMYFGVNKFYSKADSRLSEIIADIKSFLEK